MSTHTYTLHPHLPPTWKGSLHISDPEDGKEVGIPHSGAPPIPSSREEVEGVRLLGSPSPSPIPNPKLVLEVGAWLLWAAAMEGSWATGVILKCV